jgi:hypothetical protein
MLFSNQTKAAKIFNTKATSQRKDKKSISAYPGRYIIKFLPKI